jgi:hypothetical protein
MDGVPRDFVAEPVGAQEIEAGAVTDTAIGNRTINIDGGDGDIPVTGTLTSLLSGIASRLKAFRERLVTSIRPVSTALDTVFPSEKAVSGALADEAAARNMEIGAETARATAAENALASGKQNALNRTVQANLASTAAATDTGGNIAPGVAGVLPMANGGTGADTLLGTGGVASKIFPVSMTQADSPILACINSNYAKVGYIQSAEICKAFISQYCYWS